MFAADTIYWGALDRAGLGSNWEIYEKADRLARKSRVERERIRVREKRDPLTLVNDVRAIPIEEQIDCLSETLSLVESHMPSLLTRAEIWADGDVALLATSAHPKLFVQACEAALQSGEQSSRINQLLNAKWLSTADEALKTHRTTVAILDIAEIIEPDGLVSDLLDRGYVIEGPVRSPSSSVTQAQGETSALESPYLGQIPPGLTPEVFAPGIVSIDGRSESTISFSPELDEVLFHASIGDEKPAIYFSKLEGNKWTPIERADFTTGRKDEEVHPFVSHDGERIYFTAYSSDVFDTGIWFVDRLESSWSDAVKLDLPIGDDKAFGFNQANSGNLYFFNIAKGKNSYASYNDGGFPQVVEFNIEPGVVHVFTSPDEDYFMAHSLNDEGDDRDLYVSFKKRDGTWGTPIILGSEVNSDFNESVPTISPDGKYLFFGRDEEDGTGNIYWVSTEVIERLRPEL